MIWPNGVKQIPSGDSASAGERKASDRERRLFERSEFAARAAE